MGKPSADVLQETERKNNGTNSCFLISPTMARPSPSKSQILAALDLPGDGSLLQRHPLSRQEKRKRGAEYASVTGAPLNKRQACGTSRTAINGLPAGLLVSTQSPRA